MDADKQHYYQEQELEDYVSYVQDKIDMDEMPFTFKEWQQANVECAY